MKLYFSPGSCGLASQIALRETGRTFELVKVDFKTKTTTEGDYFEVSKKGLIPALKLDNGDVLTESAVILQWIADQSPEHGLLPPFGTQERYRALEWLNFAATDLHRGMAVLFSPFVDEASKGRFAEGVMSEKFAYIDAHLRDKDYVLGERFTIADAYIYNVLRWPPRVNIDLSRYEAIHRFMERMERRPHVLAAVQGEGLLLKPRTRA